MPGADPDVPGREAWTQQPFEQSGDLRTITWIGDRYFATAPDGPGLLWSSTDGSAWVPAAVEGGPARPDLGAVVEWQLAATPETAVWLGPAGWRPPRRPAPPNGERPVSEA